MIRYLLIVMAMFIAAGCGSEYSATGAPPKADREVVTPRLVRVVPASQDTMARGTVVTGTLAAEDQVVVSFKVDGRLRDIAVDLGSRVRQGQIIAQLDPTDFRLRVGQAEALVSPPMAGTIVLTPSTRHWYARRRRCCTRRDGAMAV